jgi:hypothetical protein
MAQRKVQGESMKPEDKQRVGAIVDRILDAADKGIDQHRGELAAILGIIAPRLDERAALAAAEQVIEAVIKARDRGDERGRRRRMRLAAFRAVLGVVIEAVT